MNTPRTKVDRYRLTEHDAEGPAPSVWTLDEALCDLERYRASLESNEAANATIEKYMRDVSRFLEFLRNHRMALAKQSVVAYKNDLAAHYAPASVNSMLAAINGFLVFAGHSELTVRRLKTQRTESSATQELTKREYERLVKTARSTGDEEMSLAIQTICATGIRVSELSFVTVEAVQARHTTVRNKGKTRRVWLPEKLCRMLLKFARKKKRTHGPVFVTRTGRPIDRTRIWRKMKKLAKRAGVDAHKVFPHNLRHLFALTFYRCHRDIDALSDVLGHTRIETTRIYLRGSEQGRRKQVEHLNLVI